MYRISYVIGAVVLMAMFAGSASAQHYDYGCSPSDGAAMYGSTPYATSAVYYPVGGNYRAAPQTYYQPIGASGVACQCGNASYYGSAYRPVLFPRVRRLLRRVFHPFGGGY